MRNQKRKLRFRIIDASRSSLLNLCVAHDLGFICNYSDETMTKQEYLENRLQDELI